MINVFQPEFGQEEIAAVTEVLRSGWVGKGERVLEFEKQFAALLKCDPRLVLSTTTCTEGLFLAGELFGFGPDAEIIVPSVSFPAVASAVASRKAVLRLCDVDQRSLNVGVEHILPHVNSRTRAVFVNHYGGIPVDMDPIMDLCAQKKIALIEDAACAVNSTYKDRSVGTFGDLSAWSFDAMKTVSTGDGGMLCFRDGRLREVAAEILYLGLPARQKSGIDSSSAGNARWWEFEMNRPGRRAIMNNIAGALGCVQLSKLPSFIQRRRDIWNFYADRLADVGDISLPPVPSFKHTSSYYFFWIQTKRRDSLARHLLDRGIYSTFRYWPLHRVKLFQAASDQCPGAHYASNVTLNIPLHHSLSDSDVEDVVKEIRDFYG